VDRPCTGFRFSAQSTSGPAGARSAVGPLFPPAAGCARLILVSGSLRRCRARGLRRHGSPKTRLSWPQSASKSTSSHCFARAIVSPWSSCSISGRTTRSPRTAAPFWSACVTARCPATALGRTSKSGSSNPGSTRECLPRTSFLHGCCLSREAQCCLRYRRARLLNFSPAAARNRQGCACEHPGSAIHPNGRVHGISSSGTRPEAR
jgi:hypothetical protein